MTPSSLTCIIRHYHKYTLVLESPITMSEELFGIGRLIRHSQQNKESINERITLWTCICGDCVGCRK